MFESNFPVDKLSCSYKILWNMFKLITKNASKEKAALFHDTAAESTRYDKYLLRFDTTLVVTCFFILRAKLFTLNKPACHGPFSRLERIIITVPVLICIATALSEHEHCL